jgi:hypothetical protein
MTARRQRLFAADIRTLGGTVTVLPGRDRVTGEQFYLVDHTTLGGEVAWTSSPLSDEEFARQAARVLAEFTGSAVS